MTRMTPTLAVNAYDPTRTVTLRRQIKAHLNAMWRRIHREVAAYIQRLPDNMTRAERIMAVNAHLRMMAEQEMRATESSRQRGLAVMLMAGYLRGIQLTDTDLRRLGVETTDTPQEAVSREDHRAELALLLLLYRQRLQGIVDTAVAAAQERYAAAVNGGLSLDEQVGAVRDRLDKVGATRSRGMGASAIVAAVAAATLARLGQYGVRFVGIQAEVAEYRTARDALVCKKCVRNEQRDNGYGPGIYTLDKARGLIPVHDDCRCRWLAVGTGEMVEIA